MIPIGMKFKYSPDLDVHIVPIDGDRDAYAVRDEAGAVLIGFKSRGLPGKQLAMSEEAAEALWFALADALGMGAP